METSDITACGVSYFQLTQFKITYGSKYNRYGIKGISLVILPEARQQTVSFSTSNLR
jgi:hypothetical protein